jgi:hypothetical protein
LIHAFGLDRGHQHTKRSQSHLVLVTSSDVISDFEQGKIRIHGHGFAREDSFGTLLPSDRGSVLCARSVPLLHRFSRNQVHHRAISAQSALAATQTAGNAESLPRHSVQKQ